MMSTVCAFSAQSILTLLAGLAVAHAQTAALFSVDFEEMDIGLQPTGFSTDLTGDGGPANWVVEPHDASIGRGQCARAEERRENKLPISFVRL